MTTSTTGRYPPTENFVPQQEPEQSLVEIDREADDADDKKHFADGLFSSMANTPAPYILILPFAFLALAIIGWTRDNIIEDEVDSIWIATKGSYARDSKYAEDLGQKGLPASVFAAMAIGKKSVGDNNDKPANLFTAASLEQIRARMQETESTTVELGGKTFGWPDFCFNAGGFPYEFPCARLSPMDFFQEANWFFDSPKATAADDDDFALSKDIYRRTWYREIVHTRLIRPRLPRFGIMATDCSAQCGAYLGFRLTPNSTGYGPLKLFADIGNMEMSDPCRICIEATYEGSIEKLAAAIPATFSLLSAELKRASLESNNDDDATSTESLQRLASSAENLAASITADDVKDFYYYYAVRGVYAKLGSREYLVRYNGLSDSIVQCQTQGALLGMICPPLDIGVEDAEKALRNHADAGFSSVTTAGAPLPIWESSDGLGELFRGSNPVGGSGISMSGTVLSMTKYLDVENFQTDWNPLYGNNGTGFVDPTSDLWLSLVEADPVYAWFMASEVEASNTTACGNGFLTGTRLNATYGPILDVILEVDANTSAITKASSQFWCTPYSIPNANNPGEGPYSVQYFARMWYDLLVDSESFLNVTEGVQDPYSWTTGQGCGYDLKGERFSYTNQTDEAILRSASRELYYVDEGETIGVVAPDLLIGDNYPSIGSYSPEKPLQNAGVLQTLYAILKPEDLMERVRNCKRPSGPYSLTFEQAEELVYKWKEAMEDTWTQGWEDKSENIQFVGFSDDEGVIGSTGRMLTDFTLANNKLTAVSILLIAVFSIFFLFSGDLVESRVLITLVGVALVVLSFFGAVGFAILIGIKLSIAIAWTLPFIIIGLGVDDMYIVLHALKRQKGYTKRDFMIAMREVLVPITMTSLVNASMFAVVNTSDIPAVVLTARVADFCVIALYIAIIFCFPAFCYLDMRRQAARKQDICCCCSSKRGQQNSKGVESQEKTEDFRSVLLFDKFYEPIVLGKNPRVRSFFHCLIWWIGGALFVVGVYGVTQRKAGIGLEDFFPASNPANAWATKRTESLASWSIGIRWGEIDYTEPATQMKMIKQFEDVVESPHVADVDTKQLWMATFLVWASSLCEENFDREDFSSRECGKDKEFAPGLTCSASWQRNTYGLRNKIFSDITDPKCYPHEGGICRPGNRMHPKDAATLGIVAALNATDSYCPVIDDWSSEQWKYCLRQWRNITDPVGGILLLDEGPSTSGTECFGGDNSDENITWPIKLTGGPTMFSFDLFSHEDTLDMMRETRSVCDESDELHCWMTGVPYDYWSQYEGIFEVLLRLAGYSIAIGFGISFFFLFVTLSHENIHATGKIFCGSLIGAGLIALTIILSMVAVVGLSVLAGVSLAGFSNLAFILSAGFSVEYAVHIVARWLRADLNLASGVDRVRHTMSFLMLPTFMSFVSSTIGAICLVFTEFEFTDVYFFRSLIIVMLVTYFYGCWWLPTALAALDYDVVKLGASATKHSGQVVAAKIVEKGQVTVLKELPADFIEDARVAL